MAKFTLLQEEPVPEIPDQPKGKYTLVTPEMEQSYIAGLARTGIGQGALLGFGDEITAGLRSIGDETYDDALADERAKVARFRKDNPKAALVAELAGGFATPGLGIATSAMKPAVTTFGRAVQGAKLGGGFGAGYGFGTAEGGLENRLSGAQSGAVAGAAVGAAIPTAIGAIGSVKQKVSDAVRPGVVRMTKGVDAAADEIMAQRVRDSGNTVPGIRKQMGDAEESGRFWSNSQSPVPIGIVDTSPAMQKLAGSTARSSTEAGDRAAAFFAARQTGKTPKGEGAKQFVDEAGLAVRNPFSKSEAGAAPAGQFERIRDAMHRTFTIKDKDFHEFGKNAYRTEKDMMAALKSKAQAMFPNAYNDAKPFDLMPALADFDAKMVDRAGNHLAVLQRAKKLFLDPKSPNGAPLGSPEHLKRFQSAKEMLDDTIEAAMRSGKGKLAGDLTEFRRSLTAAAKQSNPKYADALEYYSSQMELKDAIDLGRKAFNENPEVTVDQFMALNEGQKKLFRLGLLESYEYNIGRSPRANDVTNRFENPNIQELLRNVIPRTEKKGAVFSDRPERFGDFISTEKEMVKSRDKVLGNSMTQERAMDDAKFTRQNLSQMVDRLRLSGGVTGVVFEATAAAMNKLFGIREDVASEIAKRLFTVKPAEREIILQRLEKIVGPASGRAFRDALANITMAASAALGGQAGQAAIAAP